MAVEHQRHEVRKTITPDNREVIQDVNVTERDVPLYEDAGTVPIPVVQPVVEPAVQEVIEVPPPRHHDGVVITETPTHQVREEVHVTHLPGYDRRERVVRDSSATWRVFLARLAAVIWLAFEVIIGLIVFRLVLSLLGANPTNTFTAFVYNLSAVFMAPFENLTRSPAVGNGVLDIPAIIAIVTYGVIAFALVRLLKVLFAPSSRVAVRRRVETVRRDTI